MREVEILKKKQLKCYLYTRVSTSMQVDGYSLDAQRDKLRKYAAYEDMIVAGEYSDEGFSGKNIQGRQEFQRMLNDIQDGKDDVSYVLVFKLSRFGRNAADVLNSLQLMQDFGVNLICVEDGIDSSKDAGKLMISVQRHRGRAHLPPQPDTPPPKTTKTPRRQLYQPTPHNQPPPNHNNTKPTNQKQTNPNTNNTTPKTWSKLAA